MGISLRRRAGPAAGGCFMVMCLSSDDVVCRARSAQDEDRALHPIGAHLMAYVHPLKMGQGNQDD